MSPELYVDVVLSTFSFSPSLYGRCWILPGSRTLIKLISWSWFTSVFFTASTSGVTWSWENRHWWWKVLSHLCSFVQIPTWLSDSYSRWSLQFNLKLLHFNRFISKPKVFSTVITNPTWLPEMLWLIGTSEFLYAILITLWTPLIYLSSGLGVTEVSNDVLMRY